MTTHPAHRDSVLFITLDSCRYDSFAAAAAPNLKAVGPLHRAQAPSHFTYGAHAAMFVGFLPSLPGARVPILDSKFAKLFKLQGTGFAAVPDTGFPLAGRSIIDGFHRQGYRTIGTGAVRWFDPATPTGTLLTQDFAAYYYPGSTWRLGAQLAWIDEQLNTPPENPARDFVFLNVGETHTPYYFEGAPWDPADNPCVPYQTADRAAECRHRQRAAVEYVDTMLTPLIARFANATICVCADHGDCWGEDGLWEHGVSHPMTLTVPMLVRLRGVPVTTCEGDP